MIDSVKNKGFIGISMTALIVAGFFVLPVFANAQSYPVTQTTQGGYSYTMPYGNWSYPSPYYQEAPYPVTPGYSYAPCSNYWEWGCGYNWYQQPISITNVSGPNTLSIGQTGTWRVTTNAQSNSYVSISVQWGDEMNYGYAMDAYAPQTVQQQNTFTHAYQRAGTYTITFTATDQYGQSNTSTASVQVGGGVGCTYNCGTEQVTASPTSGQAPLGVTFEVSNANLNTTYYIDYGDGADAQMESQCFYGSQGCSTSVRSSHTYTHAGTFTARVSASASCPQGLYCPMYLRNVGSVTIMVSGYGQSGNFSAQPTSGQAPLSVVFTSNMYGTVDFGDGQSGNMQQNCATGFSGPANCNTGSYFTTHTYSYSGTYTATLRDPRRVCVAAGCDIVGTVTIAVSGSSPRCEYDWYGNYYCYPNDYWDVTYADPYATPTYAYGSDTSYYGYSDPSYPYPSYPSYPYYGGRYIPGEGCYSGYCPR